MALDNSGFRSLVEQIQERDRTVEFTPRERPPVGADTDRPPREPRRDGPRRVKGRSDGMLESLSTPNPAADAPKGLLVHRWL